MNQQKEKNSIFNRFLAGIEYMGNKILNNGTKEVPKYQYRTKRKN